MIDKLLGMDTGTRERTATALVTGIADALTLFEIYDVPSEKVELIIKFVLMVWTIFAWGYLSHYKNNDYTVEACEATGEMRAKKLEENGDYAITDPNQVEEVEDE